MSKIQRDSFGAEIQTPKTVTFTLTEREAAMVCDALYTCGGNYRRSGQDFMRPVGKLYEELASKLSDESARQTL